MGDDAGGSDAVAGAHSARDSTAAAERSLGCGGGGAERQRLQQGTRGDDAEADKGKPGAIWGVLGSPDAADMMRKGSGLASSPLTSPVRLARVASWVSEDGSALAKGFRRRRSTSSSIQFAPGAIGWSRVTNAPVSRILQTDWYEPTVELLRGEAGEVGPPRPRRRRRRTKIVCAIGPASRSVETLVELLEAGMNVARLNFSHGNHEYHAETLSNIKEAVRRRQAEGAQCHCAILMDTKGPEIRTGFLKNHEPVELKIHQKLEITTDFTLLGDSSRVACSYEHLASSVEPGQQILIADGSISCTVLEVLESSVIVRVENNAILEERKNMNIPGVSIRLEGITEKDRFDIENFALKHPVDIVSGSFIRTAANVRSLRECLGERGKHIRVHAKIESVEGLQNIHDILREADGVHVSRGDLGMELPLSKLFLAQKAIISWANLAGKPVVTSTQMLDSMTDRPRPTNAECSDVANAVLDGTDCVMLSAETAKGDYPRESIETMARILSEAEQVIDYDSHFLEIRKQVLSSGNVNVMESLASSAVESAMDVDAPLIVLISETGKLPMLVAKYRPLARILVATTNEVTARQMSVSRGVSSFLLTGWTKPPSPAEAWLDVSRHAYERRWVEQGDRVVLVLSPLDGDLNRVFNMRKDYKTERRLTNCVEIRVVA